MKKLILISLFIVMVVTGCSQPVSDKAFNDLPRLSFDEYQAFLDEGQSGVVYFGWTDHCPDSGLIQKNYLYELVANETNLKDNMYVVNLDQELPDGLTDKDLRQPMMDRFGVQYGPTLLLIEKGEVVDMIEWTPLGADDKTAISKETIDEFFADAGYLE